MFTLVFDTRGTNPSPKYDALVCGDLRYYESILRRPIEHGIYFVFDNWGHQVDFNYLLGSKTRSLHFIVLVMLIKIDEVPLISFAANFLLENFV